MFSQRMFNFFFFFSNTPTKSVLMILTSGIGAPYLVIWCGPTRPFYCGCTEYSPLYSKDVVVLLNHQQASMHSFLLGSNIPHSAQCCVAAWADGQTPISS